MMLFSWGSRALMKCCVSSFSMLHPSLHMIGSLLNHWMRPESSMAARIFSATGCLNASRSAHCCSCDKCCVLGLQQSSTSGPSSMNGFSPIWHDVGCAWIWSWKCSVFTSPISSPIAVSNFVGTDDRMKFSILRLRCCVWSSCMQVPCWSHVSWLHAL